MNNKMMFYVMFNVYCLIILSNISFGNESKLMKAFNTEQNFIIIKKEISYGQIISFLQQSKFFIYKFSNSILSNPEKKIRTEKSKLYFWEALKLLADDSSSNIVLQRQTLIFTPIAISSNNQYVEYIASKVFLCKITKSSYRDAVFVVFDIFSDKRIIRFHPIQNKQVTSFIKSDTRDFPVPIVLKILGRSHLQVKIASSDLIPNKSQRFTFKIPIIRNRKFFGFFIPYNDKNTYLNSFFKLETFTHQEYDNDYMLAACRTLFEAPSA